MIIKIYRDGFAPTQTGHGNADLDVTRSIDHAANRARTEQSGAVRATGRTTPSGRASMLADGAADSLSQATAIGNVVVTVLLVEKETPGADAGARADELMAELAATTEAITAEITGQLVTRQ